MTRTLGLNFHSMSTFCPNFPLLLLHPKTPYIPLLLLHPKRMSSTFQVSHSSGVPVAPPGVVPRASTEELLSEVSNLVESPRIVVGSFASKFLELPK